MARSDEEMEQNRIMTGNNPINVVHVPEITLKDDNYGHLFYYIHLIEILLQNIS